MSGNTDQRITLERIAKNIYFHWELEDWFKWPPDIFALISIVLLRTGSYRICLMETAWWEDRRWQKQVVSDSRKWKAECNRLLANEEESFSFSDFEILKIQYKVLENLWGKTDINQLRTLGDLTLQDADKEINKFAIALVSILAVADTCCAGLGLVGQNTTSAPSYNLFKGVANTLLSTTGSLSTLSKFHGTVIPKMRTPQAGIALRSLSHHLTFHVTEVEVVWRTIPWLHDNKQSLNLMVVPYPYKIRKTDFHVIDESYYSSRYFKGNIKGTLDEKFLNNLVAEVNRKSLTNNEVDIVVLPEMSLSEKQYKHLLNLFSASYKEAKYNTDYGSVSRTSGLQLPIVVSGVLHGIQNPESNDTKVTPAHNEVRIAIFFDGKWYDITQRKHHRWQLDRNQILQYGLEGYFPTGQNWYELCSILQRRLTIVAPNSWLALTALICEDLARQEPVGEVIRGIGPTLLLALLSDGPQIVNRWSARYASVLADDPGTAVLSVTSKGMAQRSSKPEFTVNDDKGIAVGLWKDMIRGWKELYLTEGNDALLFTISAKFEEEFTLDGRTDGATSSVFKMDSLKPKQIRFNRGTKTKSDDISPSTEDNSPENDFGNWHDIRILSSLLFLIDALVDIVCTNAPGDDVARPIEIVTSLFDNTSSSDSGHFSEIKKKILTSWISPSEVGIATITFTKKDLLDELKRDVKEIRTIIKLIYEQKDKPGNQANLLDIIIGVCRGRMEDYLKGKNKGKTISMLFLYNLHSKISGCKTSQELNARFKDTLMITPDKGIALRKKIIALLHEFRIEASFPKSA